MNLNEDYALKAYKKKILCCKHEISKSIKISADSVRASTPFLMSATYMALSPACHNVP